MSIISRVTTWSDNQTLTASALNGEFNNILNDYNGSVTNANISASAAIGWTKISKTGSLLSDLDDVSASAPTTNQVLQWSGSTWQPGTVQVNRAFAWYVSGTLTTGTNFGPRYVVPQSMTIVKCWLIARTGPSSQAILIDINKNGSTIWSSQGNRGTIASGATTGNTTTFNTTALSAGDYLDFDIDQVGSGTAGVDLTIVLECSQP
jgi:hypothetical protein